MNEELVPLYSLEAEMSVLGSMLLSERALSECVGRMSVSDFWRPAHRLIFKAMSELASKSIQADIITLMDKLTALQIEGQKTPVNCLADAGGEDYLIEIAEYVPSPANAQFYADIVLNKSRLRECEKRFIEGLNLVRTGGTVEESQSLAAGFASLVPDRKAVVSMLYEANSERDDDGVSTGWPSLDRTSSRGGYPCGQLTMFTAPTGHGKTCGMQSSAIIQCQSGLKVLYATFADIDRDELKRRAMKMTVGRGKRPLDDLEWSAKYDRGLLEVEMWDFQVYDSSDSDDRMYAETFAAYVKAELPARKWDVIYVDYAQEMISRTAIKDGEVANQNACARCMARMAKQINIPVVVGAQITEGGKGQKDAIAYSKVWEQVAGWILRIRPEGIEVTKSRYGGKDSLVPVQYNKEFARIEDYGK